MEAINRAERTTSLINFIVVYIIILAIPLIMAFFAGTRRHVGSGTTQDTKEYESLQAEMAGLQVYTKTMHDQDLKFSNMSTASPAAQQAWLDEAQRDNKQFSNAIEDFRSMPFGGARGLMQTSACTYLDALHTERGANLQYLARQLGIQSQNLTVEQLKDKNSQLQMANTGLQNQIGTLNALLAQKPAAEAGGGGGGSQDAGVVTDLKWQLRFKDADCNKRQADLLAAYNEAEKRKRLYTSAKVNFQQIAQLARNSYMLQQSATEKVREIDQKMNSL